MKNKTKLMIVMCVAVAIMAVGYAAFSTVLNISGTANISSEWKVVFTNIEQVSKTSGVTVKTAPQASGTSATFDVGLTSPGDKIVYKITLANQGTLDAIIKDIKASATDSAAIIFSVTGVNIGDTLTQKTSKELTVTIEYDPYVTTQPDKLQKTLTVSVETEQKINQSITPGAPSVDQPTYLSSYILRDNVAQPDTNIDLSKPSTILVYSQNGPSGTTSEVTFESNKSYYFGKGFTFDESSGLYQLTGQTYGKWSSMSTKYTTYPYTCVTNSYYGNCEKLYKMASYTSETTGQAYVYTSSLVSSSDNGQGLYYTSTKTENGLPTYYYRGDVNNNHIQMNLYTKEVVDSVCEFVSGDIRISLKDENVLVVGDYCTYDDVGDPENPFWYCWDAGEFINVNDCTIEGGGILSASHLNDMDLYILNESSAGANYVLIPKDWADTSIPMSIYTIRI